MLQKTDPPIRSLAVHTQVRSKAGQGLEIGCFRRCVLHQPILPLCRMSAISGAYPTCRSRCLGQQPSSSPRGNLSPDCFRKSAPEHALDHTFVGLQKWLSGKVGGEGAVQKAGCAVAFDFRLGKWQETDHLHPSRDGIRRNRSAKKICRTCNQKAPRSCILVDRLLQRKDQIRVALDLVDYCGLVAPEETNGILSGELQQDAVVKREKGESLFVRDAPGESGLA